MSVARLLAVARKEAIQIRRDPRSLGMAFVIPMLLLFLYGYALTLDVKDVDTVVWDQDRTAESREFVRGIEASGYFRVLRAARSLGDVQAAIDAGEAKVGLVIPLNFARDLERGRRTPVQALLDGSDANTATIAMGYLEAATARYSARLTVSRAGLAPIPADARLRVWFNADLKSKNYIVPGLIAVIMMVIAALLTSLTIAREWERGTMEQLIATPIRVSELLAGKLLPYSVIGLLDVALAASAGTFVFGVPFRGSPALLLGLAVIFLLGALSLGLLVSIHARSQLVASQVAVMATFLPAFLLSGFVFDINNMPAWLRLITYAVPARYFVAILKGLFLKGVGAQALVTEAAFLILFGLVVVALAARGFRKRLA